jgi:chorismate mutase/prephenate dehydratase
LREIEALRDRIDRIDDQLLKLLNRRAELAIRIGREKSKLNSTQHFHVPQREREIIARLQGQNRGAFSNSALESVFREIFSATLALEKPLTIAYLGPETTFSHQAAVKQFGHSAVFLPRNSINAIFAAVEKGVADYGMAPIENSIEGVVTPTIDGFFDSPLLINDEIKLEIHLYLLSKSKSVDAIRKVYSHPQPLAQCRNWLLRNLPHAELIPSASTAAAAIQASKEPKSAAVAGLLAAEHYKLEVLASRIEDRKENHTRFLIVGKERAKKAKHNKTSVMFSIKDEAGSLLRALQLFAKRKINLTKIQSRPLPNRPWEYLFFIDLEGHLDDKPVAEALRTLERQCLFLKFLGSYPRKV